ncbi:MAG: glycosyltransferase [Lachnospiraceae bacterium]|nr:glycosyltransferase [Lachnospiraceae bacterium]
MTENQPMVSICCITYNQASYIRDALEGFLKQKTDFAYEVLIHDDASTDGTAEIIREYATRYPDRILPILQTQNQYALGRTSVSGLYNFPRVRGRYVAMCEGDDYWTDAEKLQMQVDYMEAHPDCSLCFHSARVEVQGRAVTEQLMRPYRSDRRITSEEIIDKTSGYPTASLLFRSEMIARLPDFYMNAPIADIPLQLLAAARGWAYYMDRPMCVYRLGGAASWTTLMKQGNYEEKQRQYAQAMERMYRGFDEESGGRFHAAAEHAIRRLTYLTKVNTKQYAIVLAPENREFYRELTLRTRFFIRLETGAPWLYGWLLKLWNGSR